MQKRTFFMIGGAAALVLLSTLFGAFFAGPLLASANGSSTASATPTTNPYCQQYLQDLAHRLNVSVSTLQQDKLAAREDVLNQMVKDGKLTQSQAAMIKQHLESHQACSGKGSLGQHFVTRQFLQKYRSDIANEVAQGLHLSPNQLMTDLKSGKSLSDIATTQHVTTVQLHTLVTNAIQDALHKAVSAGDLTQAQADAFTQLLQKHPAFLDHLLGRHFGK
jgi:polyhydroxyalkanoate synthesis regulator phasin